MSIRRSLCALALSVSALAGGSALAPSPAGALTSTIGGGSTNLGTSGTIGGGTASSLSIQNPADFQIYNLECNPFTDVVSFQPIVTTAFGFTGGQWVSYRYYLESFTTGWSYVYPYNAALWAAGGTGYPYSSLQAQRLALPDGQSWRVLVEVIRWNGSQWVSTGWKTPNMVTKLGANLANFNCWT
jgi:hypothetical protein